MSDSDSLQSSESTILDIPQIEIGGTIPPLIGDWSSAERFKYARKLIQRNMRGLESEISSEKLAALTTPLTSIGQIADRYRYKIWRLNNCYKIVNKHGEKIPFVMNRAQLRAYLSLNKHKRLCILKSRQQGISTLWLVVFVDDCLNHSNVSSGMISYKNQSAQDLLFRANLIYDYMEPFAVKQGLLNTRRVKSNEAKGIKFNNNSILRISTTFMGSTLNNLHISELGPIAADDASRAETIFRESVQTAHERAKVIIESTARGENKFSDTYRKGIKEKARLEGVGMENAPPYKNIKISPTNLSEILKTDIPQINQSSDSAIKIPAQKFDMSIEMFYPVFLSWLDDESCRERKPQQHIPELKEYEEYLTKHGITLTEEQRNFWCAKHSSIGHHIFAEFPATDEEAFYVSTEGTIYASHYKQYAHFNEELPNTISTAVKQLDGKLSTEEFHWNFDPRLPVYASFDLGIDNNFIVWYQINDNKLVILRESSMSDLGVSAWSEKLHSYPEYRYESIILPHDAMIRQKDEAANRVYDLMTDKGHDCQISTSKNKAYEDTRLVTEIIQHMYINPNHTPLLHKAFTNYRKEFDKTRNCWLDKPRHDDHSHPMDSIRYFVKEYYDEIIGNTTERQDIDF